MSGSSRSATGALVIYATTADRSGGTQHSHITRAVAGCHRRHAMIGHANELWSAHERSGSQRLQGQGAAAQPRARQAAERAPTELEIAHHPGGAVVVALDADNRVCLLRQFRHATGGWITELPAGKIDDREDPLAMRQARTGRRSRRHARRWDTLGDFYSSPGVLTEVIHVFLARTSPPATRARAARSVRHATGCRWPKPWRSRPPVACRTPRRIIGLVWARTRLAWTMYAKPPIA